MTTLSAPATAAAPWARTGRHRARLRTLGGRLGFYLIAAWSAITLNFLLPRLMTGDATGAIVQQMEQKSGGTIAPETVESISKLFGERHATIFVQYGDYLAQLAHGDLGLSLTNFPTPVSALIGSALPWTLLLVGTATLLPFLVGTALGALCGWRSGGRLEECAECSPR